MSEAIQRNDESSGLTNDLPVMINPEVVVTENKSTVDLELRYGIKLGGYGLLVPKSMESEVIISPNIFPIPNTTDLMAGLISVRGRFAPVFNLGKILNLDLNSRQTSTIVMTIDGDLLAFPYDSAHSLELPASVAENQPQLPEALTQLAGNRYQIGQEFWIEFDFKTCIKQVTNKISQ